MANQPTLALCIIVKDEAATIEQCLAGALGVCNEIHVVDTGSTDETLLILEALQEFHPELQIHHFKWIDDFSAAREFSFSKATTDWLIWWDADDVVSPTELRDAKAKLATIGDANVVMLPYNYNQDELGNCLCLLKRERFIRRDATIHAGGFGKWHGGIHEAFRVPDLRAVHWDTPCIIHRRQDSVKGSSFDRNIAILEREYAEFGDSDLRVLLHLGSEYRRVGRHEEAVEFLMKFAEKAQFIEEKYWATHRAAQCCGDMQRWPDSFDLALQGITINPSWPDSWIVGGYALYHQRQFDQAIRWLETGLKLDPPTYHLYTNPLEYSMQPHQILQAAYAERGRFADALASCQKVLAIRPDPASEFNATIFQGELNLADFERTSASIANRLADENHARAHTYIDCLPEDVQQRTEVVRVKKRLIDAKYAELEKLTGKKKRDLVVSVAVNFEQWGPANPEKVGIGGSETAIVRMLEELQQTNDFRCIVYNHVGDQEGVGPKGVEYWRPELYDGKPVDVFIASRYTSCFDSAIMANQKWVWLQDVHCGALTPYQDTRIDRYLVLTGWHKQNFLRVYPFVKPEKVFITYNAIDLDRFDNTCTTCKGRKWDCSSCLGWGTRLERDHKRVQYASSPDRGLDNLLELWPDVIQQVPDAELHIYYGFDNIDKLIAQGNAYMEQFKHKLLSMMDHPSITFHGRQGQKIVANGWLQTGVWAYPTSFCETSCITALEAQAGGALVLTTPLAALTEVVPGAVFVNGHAGSCSYQEVFTEKLVDMLQHPEKYEENRQRGYEFAKTRTWENAAKQWLSQLL
jgi:glycosyltransferase involved in cell wall biosynthesis